VCVCDTRERENTCVRGTSRPFLEIFPLGKRKKKKPTPSRKHSRACGLLHAATGELGRNNSVDKLDLDSFTGFMCCHRVPQEIDQIAVAK